ncbi:GNAT family N-acetyltransferase [Micromonospora endolithica]|uniref:N-acetyltransferase n=1 Tax=Micromonospora endolithica TaxID=230091 RepID=A0A3A9YV04_9ACTN|nr:GNAT family N-acetyltransferase [Micromonospora endolithica]RKN39067.1 N-acetyltransferase [Micromonospora endolithica]TWJ25563.1 acetyltransferase (GNAT) family protein [Micromonospora endolithica]
MSIVVTPFDVSDPAAIDEAHRIATAATAADVPDFPLEDRAEFGATLAHPTPGNGWWHALARVDGIAVGRVQVRLPQLDNTDLASVTIEVHPEHRRRGAGRALFASAREVAGEHGRKRLFWNAVAALPGGPPRPEAGAAFSAATGAKPALAEVRRRLDTTGVDQAALDALLAEARSRADGYRVVGWHGRVPDEYVADVARLEGRILTDAPMGDLDMEPEKVDDERIRGIEAALTARGRRVYHHGAVDPATGALVAWTMLDVGGSAPWHAWQATTIVDPDHRGHRLGLIVKIENLRYALAREPRLTAIDTWNAAVNDYMININERMGFRAVDAWTDWQLDL